MRNVMLDLDVDMNNIPNKTWELMGNPTFVWIPIQIKLDNHSKVFPIGRLIDVEANVDGVKIVVEFEVV